MKPIEYRLEICDTTRHHGPVAVLLSPVPFPSIQVGDRFDDEGWPRLDSRDVKGTAETPVRFVVHSIKHVVF